MSLVASSASGQNERARAESLFREGKQLLADKKYDEACPRFAESLRLDASSGVALALGLCYESAGKIASAWGAYSAATSIARKDARSDREAAALEKVAVLEAQLSRVTFAVAPETAQLAGLTLLQDGVDVGGSVSWANGPVDAGKHSLKAVAPGYAPYEVTFDIGSNGARVTVPVPPLASLTVPVVAPAAPPPVVAAPIPPPPAAPSSALRTSSFVAGGVGAGALVTGAVLGGMAISKAHSVNSACPRSPCRDSAAVSENSTAGAFADASTGLFIAGGTLFAAGVVMFILAPSRHQETAAGVTLRPVVGPASFGVTGSF
jgi:hypothetical protein